MINAPKPIPSAGLEAYKIQLDQALASDPRKKNNYQLYLSEKGQANISYLPIKLDIENVSRCNFRCKMCVVSNWHKGQRSEDLTLESFKEIIDEQYGLVEVKIQGIGEPTLQRDDYFSMIKYARSKMLWVRTTTNGSLLHLNDNIKKFIDSDPNEVQISFDGATKQTFEKIRRQSNFEQVCRNVFELNKQYINQNKRRTKMWILVQKENQHELFEFVKLAENLGFRDMVFTFSLSNWGRDDWRIDNNEIESDLVLNQQLIDTIIEKSTLANIRAGFWFSTEKFTKQNICPWPFERAVITADKRYVPCCTIGDPDAYEIGIGKSFLDAWYSEEYNNFRNKHLIGQIPEVCRFCYEDK